MSNEICGWSWHSKLTLRDTQEERCAGLLPGRPGLRETASWNQQSGILAGYSATRKLTHSLQARCGRGAALLVE